MLIWLMPAIIKRGDPWYVILSVNILLILLFQSIRCIKLPIFIKDLFFMVGNISSFLNALSIGALRWV